jgi:predicted ATPase
MKTSRKIETKWSVITGSPSSGKTSVLKALEGDGIKVCPDVARTLIEARLAEGASATDARGDLPSFRMAVFEAMTQDAIRTSHDELVLFDYGLPDNVAFYRASNLSVPSRVLLAAQTYRYQHVFILDQLPFHQDLVRTENEDALKRIGHEIEVIYTQLGYSPIKIPVVPLRERKSLILNRLRLP